MIKHSKSKGSLGGAKVKTLEYLKQGIEMGKLKSSTRAELHER